MHASLLSLTVGRGRLLLLTSVLLLVGTSCAFYSGCVFFEVPRDRATELLLTPVHSKSSSRQKEVPARFAAPGDPGWSQVRLDLRSWSSSNGRCSDREVETAPDECWKADSPAPESGEELAVEFLLISDAQTRDERAYEPGQLRWIDLLLESTIRLPLVEVMDGIVLQSFVSAYRQHVEKDAGSPESHFLVQGGDLLDVSLVTELVEAYETLAPAKCRKAQHQAPKDNPPQTGYCLPVYSVVGNHDGLTWGNLPDSRTTTWELGINRKEYVLGGILYAPNDDGFGFFRNEIVSAIDQGKARAANAFPETREALARIRRDKRTFEDDESKLLPVTVKGIVSVSRVEDERNQLGYYSFERDGIVFIVLDTAAKDSVDAEVDSVQLGWLYMQLRNAWRSCQPVVLFSHHGPGDFSWGRGATLERMLARFPNIVVLFHGHGHDAQVGVVEGVPVVETPSIIDYPEAGSLVRIFRRKDDSSLRVRVSLVRPEVLNATADAIELQSLLEETWIISYYENPKKFKCRYGPYRAVSWKLGSQTPISPHREEIPNMDGSLDIVWHPRCGDEEPSAAEVFGSRNAAAASKRARRNLGLPIWK